MEEVREIRTETAALQVASQKELAERMPAHVEADGSRSAAGSGERGAHAPQLTWAGGTMLALLVGQWCPMCPGNAGWGMMFFSGLFWLVVIAVVIWAIYRLVSSRRGSDQRSRPDKAETVLRERYARGEIDRDTFRRMLDDLRAGSGGSESNPGG